MKNKQQASLSSVDKDYQKWFIQYYDSGDSKKAAVAAKEIKKLTEQLIFPKDEYLRYLLGDFYYDCTAMHSEGQAAELIAISLLESAADAGIREASALLRKIFNEHNKQAKKGNATSQFILGHKLAIKNKHSKKAGRLLKAAADNGHGDAEFMLSMCYLSGDCGIARDNNAAYDYAFRAYENGKHMAAYNLGCFYDQGIVVSANKAKAKEYWELARSAGHPMAQKALDELKIPAADNLSSAAASFDMTLAFEVIFKKLDDIEKNQIDHEEMSKVRHTHLEEILKNIPAEIFNKVNNEFLKLTDEYRKLLPQFATTQEAIEKLRTDINNTKDNISKSDHKIDSLISKMNEFFDKYDAKSVELSKNTKLSELKKHHEAELEKLYGEYWSNGQMLNTTKESLIAARVLLDCAKEHKLNDCRGIVISATSALERELKARFYNGCIDFFESRTDANGVLYDEDSLPEDLRRKFDKKSLTLEDDFKLGQVKYILECEDYNTKAKLHGYSTSDQVAKLRLYLSDHIISEEITSGKLSLNGKAYNPHRPEDVFIFNAISKDASFAGRITNVAKKYRNPAAHTKDTTLITAISCCKDVIGEGKKDIKHIESLLLELLTLTKRFKHTV